MKITIRDVIFFISCGLAIGFTLIVYANSNFATKDSVNRIENFQKTRDGDIISRLNRIEDKLDKIFIGNK